LQWGVSTLTPIAFERLKNDNDRFRMSANRAARNGAAIRRNQAGMLSSPNFGELYVLIIQKPAFQLYLISIHQTALTDIGLSYLFEFHTPIGFLLLFSVCAQSCGKIGDKSIVVRVSHELVS